MEYTNFTFTSITYRNGPDRDPFVSLKYRAESLDDGTPKKAKDKFDELPQKAFREAWAKLIEFWKINLEDILGDIDWDAEGIRIEKVQIKWEDETPGVVKYVAKVSTGFDNTETIPTPYMQPGMQEGEIEVINDLCDAAEAFLHGERDQGELQFEDNEDKEEDEETDYNPETDLSNIF